MAIKLITFGDGGNNFKEASGRLAKQANKFKIFDSIEIFDFSKIDESYWTALDQSILENKKGVGLWSWKPFIINSELNKLNDRDILIYIDAGCELNIHGIKKLNEYIEYVDRNGYLLFHLQNKNKAWTKFHASFNDEEFLEKNQLVGGILFFQKNQLIIDFVNYWLDICLRNKSELLKDPQPCEQQRPEFIAHRHDQSCLSLAAHIYKLKSAPDETDFPRWVLGRKYPILALRNISAQAKSPYHFLPKPVRKILRFIMSWKWL